MGFDDAARLLSQGASTRLTLAHAGGRMGIIGGFATAGGFAGYYGSGRDMQSALFWANMATLPGNIAASFLPCFVAGTPIRTPNWFTPRRPSSSIVLV